MSFRTSEEHLAASEEFSPFCQPGSVLFSHSSEVDNWCHSIPLAEGFPLTPPDTASDSASDCPDMNGPSWSQAPLPEESWNTGAAPDHRTLLPPSGQSWHPHGVPVTADDLHALNTASWLNVTQGPVNLNLSPVLSHECQSSHSFNSMSEPETSLLPPGLDLSFIAESSWDPQGSVVYPSPQVLQDLPIMVTPQPEYPSGIPNGTVQGYKVPQSACVPPQQVYYFQGAPTPYSRRVVSDPSCIQRRPLLPRTEAQHVPQMDKEGQYPAVQLQPSAASRTHSTGSVSSIHGRCSDSVAPGHSAAQGSAAHQPRIHQTGHAVISPRPISASSSRGPTHTQDVNQFVPYDQDEKLSLATMSYPHNYAPSPLSLVANGESSPGLGKLELDDANWGSLSAAGSVSSEGEEGRHRSHPLYNDGPQSDGLFHCPFKGDPNCQHKPTKLKCNYDKFIDSHLKPFRCKIEACSKQEFSSTACLLRHEREAHGMHGHGDRPHLCYYPGCERGMLGNGFPRRYNLFDHMKRVHDHKEEPTQSFGASDVQGPRKVAGRKRKAPASGKEEPAAQRPKLQPVQQQPSPPLSLASTGLPTPYAECNTAVQSDRQQIYSQWANQRDLLKFQMSAVQSPDDEANLQRLSQNIEELRRLSQQARHG